MSERWPAAALVRVLRGRTVVDGSCDGEGCDDVRLLLDDDTVVAVDVTIVEVTDDEALKELGLGPEGRLTVTIGGRELWPHDQTR